MKSARWFISYIIVASLGLWLAFAVSARLMAPAYSQEAPSSGELPADFLKEVEATQVPPANSNPAVPPPQPSPPQGVPAPGGSAVPPPPEEMLGDGATAAPEPGATPVENAQAPATPPGEKDAFLYDPTGKRDPFRPFKAARPALDAGSKAALEPLQRWDLDKLQVVGILWDVRTPRAMIRDPDGAVHMVVKNSKIGRSEGFVATIREGEVVIVETLYEEGRASKETRVLELRR